MLEISTLRNHGHLHRGELGRAIEPDLAGRDLRPGNRIILVRRTALAACDPFALLGRFGATLLAIPLAHLSIEIRIWHITFSSLQVHHRGAASACTPALRPHPCHAASSAAPASSSA